MPAHLRPLVELRSSACARRCWTSAAAPAGCASSWRAAATGSPASTSPPTWSRSRASASPRSRAGRRGLEALAEFHAHAGARDAVGDRFDAAVLYDTMHHFDDELETLRGDPADARPRAAGSTSTRACGPGGLGGRAEPRRRDGAVRHARVAVRPGVPRRGRRGRRVHRRAPARRGGRAGGSRAAARAATGPGAFLPDRLAPGARQAALRPEFNIIHAVNPIPDRRRDAEFSGRIEAEGDWVASGHGRVRRLKITNAGPRVLAGRALVPVPEGHRHRRRRF